MRCHRWSLLLLAGCTATEPGAQDDFVPQVGRYDYRLTHNGQQFSADLVIETASAQQVRYHFYSQSPSHSVQTAAPIGESWPLIIFDLSGRSATNTMTRNGGSYSCTASVLFQTTVSPGTCAFTFEGPDSARGTP